MHRLVPYSCLFSGERSFLLSRFSNSPTDSPSLVDRLSRGLYCVFTFSPRDFGRRMEIRCSRGKSRRRRWNHIVEWTFFVYRRQAMLSSAPFWSENAFASVPGSFVDLVVDVGVGGTLAPAPTPPEKLFLTGSAFDLVQWQTVKREDPLQVTSTLCHYWIRAAAPLSTGKSVYFRRARYTLIWLGQRTLHCFSSFFGFSA